jgi:hypothetical protein
MYHIMILMESGIDLSRELEPDELIRELTECLSNIRIKYDGRSYSLGSTSFFKSLDLIKLLSEHKESV